MGWDVAAAGWRNVWPVLLLAGGFLLVQAFEPPEGDCQSLTNPRDSARNPVCIGPLTGPWPFVVGGLGVGLVTAGGFSARVAWRTRRR